MAEKQLYYVETEDISEPETEVTSTIGGKVSDLHITTDLEAERYHKSLRTLKRKLRRQIKEINRRLD